MDNTDNTDNTDTVNNEDISKAIHARTTAAARHIVRGLLDGLGKAESEIEELAWVGGYQSEDLPWQVAHPVIQFHKEMERLQRRLQFGPDYQWRGATIRAVLHGIGLDLYWIDEDLVLEVDPLNPDDL